MIFSPDILPASAHPVLPELVAKIFSWKKVNPPADLGLPFAWVDTGREVFSLPHFNHAAGPLDPFHRWKNQLEEFQKQLRKPLGLRLTADKTGTWLPKVVSLLNLSDPDALQPLQHGNLARKIRASKRKGVEVQSGSLRDLGQFIKVYHQRLHVLGSAGLPEPFFRSLWLSFPDTVLDAETTLHLAFYHNRLVGAAFSIRFGKWFENGWFATAQHGENHYAAYALHDAMIRDAIAAGATVYSFGRSTPGSGVHRFKQQWAPIDLPLTVYNIPPKTHDLRQHGWLHRIWRHIPLALARLANPHLAKYFY